MPKPNVICMAKCREILHEQGYDEVTFVAATFDQFDNIRAFFTMPVNDEPKMFLGVFDLNLSMMGWIDAAPVL